MEQWYAKPLCMQLTWVQTSARDEISLLINSLSRYCSTLIWCVCSFCGYYRVNDNSTWLATKADGENKSIMIVTVLFSFLGC